MEYTNEDILRMWNSYELTFEQRDTLLKEIQKRGLYPSVMEASDEWEIEGGLYPDVEDPRFAEKIMSKQEFAENKQDSIAMQMEDEVNPCDPDKEFELTPVQRFIGRFMSPQCPYQSALLFHGVGVGKTCAAITVAENYLRMYPKRSVIIVAPRNIQPGFRRTIFDDEALKVPEEGINMAKGCTGNTYLKRTSTEFEKDRPTVIRRVNQLIQGRYTFLGYIQFHRMIEDILKNVSKSLDEGAAKIRASRLLRREFSGRLVIIDEAHNLRDTPGESGDTIDNPGGDTDMTENQAGKKLTPSLLKVLEAAQGMKLLLLTGTPMYNSYREIIFLLKLLLMNDKRTILSEGDIFLPSGAFKPSVNGSKSGEELLGAAANAYVSFMRGENPLSFPVRLPPQEAPVLSKWPNLSIDAKSQISKSEAERMLRLPFVPLKFEKGSMEIYKRISQEALEAGGTQVNSIDEMLQSGNWIFPGQDGPVIRDAGFDECFQDSGAGGSSQFTAKNGQPTWLISSNLGTVSPKAKFTLERARSAKGVIFIYSRFISSGALPLALALEANGYVPWGDKKPLLTNGVQTGEGLQCALCEKRQRNHSGADHKFTPAKYILLTGRSSISPNNPTAIQASRLKTNLDGREVKIIIGSQVASEGVDFRFVREIYIFDSWFHLNKMEQVLGRGIRTCSHALLPEEQRNCTTYLLVNIFSNEDTETADLFMYRKAMIKAVQVGRVTRVLKRYALDCNLNREAIIVTGLATQTHVDSQGETREDVNVNDTPYTNLCDWIETCEYTCAKPVDIAAKPVDLTTYDEYAVNWREVQLKSVIRQIFEKEKQPEFQLDDILNAMSGIPMRAVSALLSDIVGNRSFRVRMGSKEGYIVYRNNYFMFQPDYLSDIRIPLALRVADVPVKRDAFDPTSISLKSTTDEGAPAAAPVEKPAIEGEAKEASLQPLPGTVQQYWKTITDWAERISRGESVIDDIPADVLAAIGNRYLGDEQAREKAWLTMISWLYEHIHKSTYERKGDYLIGLANTLLQFIWDESLRANEQLQLVQAKNKMAIIAAQEQIVEKDGVTAFRFVDPISGVLKYMCGAAPCAEAVRREFEANERDPYRVIVVNTETTGDIYGFNVPKAKERRLTFKTSYAPAPGGKVEKGGECSIVSTISYHITMLKTISDMLVSEGFPRFILTEDILDEKVRIKRERDAAKAAGTKYVPRTRPPGRTFENAVKACALKDIMFRWLDNMKARKRYFFRPVSALKSGHKGAVQKV